ncbi:aminopeptidase N [Trebonia kvetii]|uniref:Aminopeptidase N n=1 Tax=Trebonia kvetii TaxID=2480626 RepID=A0A6P2C784_9ACTN|nr:aminopeptidase N [Trebonia kvetii]TVZ06355.1 aminopeptidase N [Trebonia kvetii]
MQVAEITRDETAQRAALLRVDSYDVELDLTGGAENFRSTSVIVFDCAQPGVATYADLIAERVREITLNGASLDPAAVYAQGRIALSGLASRNELRVVADCGYAGDGSGLMRTQDSADGRSYLSTQFEAAGARKVFACFEQPDLKAEFTFHVRVPGRVIVVSNQPASRPEPAGDGSAVWHFPATPRISTYLTAIAAGEYHLVTDSHTTPSGQVVPLGLACRRSLAEFLDADEIFAITRAGLDYFTGLFGMGYPFAKYDQVFVTDSPGAMENPGCVTITEQMLFRSKVTDTVRELRADLILHEMAHMWFGDLVTMTWWNDLWLNESFAEMCATQASAEATRFTDAWITFCGGRKAWGYGQDQLPSTHPIAADAPTLSVAESNFDGISYAKGAAVLKQLVAYLGRDNFFAGIRAYLAGHAWGNATLADLLRALEASSGKPLGDWSKAWLQTAGPNTLRSEFGSDDRGCFTDFAVLQEATAEHLVLRPHHIAIGLYNRVSNDADGSDALVRTHRVEVEVAGARTPVPDLAGLPQPDLLLLNDDDLGYAIVRFDERSLTTLTTSIGAFRDGLARTICWSAVMDMAAQAELSVPAFVKIVTAGMGHEPSVSLLQQLHRFTAQRMTTSADPAWATDGKRQLAAAGVNLLRSAEPGSDHQLAWAQLLGWSATSEDQLDLLAGLLDGSQQVAGLNVDTELRWTLLARLVAMGRAGQAQIEAELERDDTNTGRKHAAACRAAIPDADHKAQAWRLLTSPGELGIEETVEVGMAFNQVEHAALLAPYADAFFDQFPAVWAARDGLVRVVFGMVLFPFSAASPELLERADAFLAEHGQDAALCRAVIEGRDVAAKALRARKLPDAR